MAQAIEDLQARREEALVALDQPPDGEGERPRDFDLADRAVTLAERREQRSLEKLRQSRALTAQLNTEAERWPNRTTSPS